MIRLPRMKPLGAAAALALVATFGLSSGAAAASGVQLSETGSTLLYPLFNEWVPVYTHTHAGVTITTQGTGSGTGISDAINGTVNIGASDAYMSDALIKQNPNLLNIPLAISAQQVMYNLPGVSRKVHLHLTGPILALMYEGKIKTWNNPLLKKLNPGVKLPNIPVVPVHRADGSGDTFLFTSYLSFTTKSWANSVGFSTTVPWPNVPGSVTGIGNGGVVDQLANYQGSVGYVGVSWLDQGLKAGLGEAAVQNRAGRFLLPTNATILAAANAQVKKTPANERMTLIYGPGVNSYPIINYEYSIINKNQPSASVAAALRTFLTWAVNPKDGNAAKFLVPVHFLPLPSNVLPLSLKQISEIK